MNLPYTDTASKALSVAQEIATEHGHGKIGTAHLLLALLQCGGVAGVILKVHGDEVVRAAKDKLTELTTGK